ncbi:MAG: hypothetical protein JW754_02295 [Candidatus Aenigmarchaeota archaeon]|nr:hypothetical protein [Candidatus Aenigmarchaeota archaeon]
MKFRYSGETDGINVSLVINLALSGYGADPVPGKGNVYEVEKITGKSDSGDIEFLRKSGLTPVELKE